MYVFFDTYMYVRIYTYTFEETEKQAEPLMRRRKYACMYVCVYVSLCMLG